MHDICTVFEKHKNIAGIISFIKEIKPVMLRYSKSDVQLNEKMSDFIIQMQNDISSSSFSKTIDQQIKEMPVKKETKSFVFQQQDFEKKQKPRNVPAVEQEIKSAQQNARTEREDQQTITTESQLFSILKKGEKQIESVIDFIKATELLGCVYPEKIKQNLFKETATPSQAWRIFNDFAKKKLQV